MPEDSGSKTTEQNKNTAVHRKTTNEDDICLKLKVRSNHWKIKTTFKETIGNFSYNFVLGTVFSDDVVFDVYDMSVICRKKQKMKTTFKKNTVVPQ